MLLRLLPLAFALFLLSTLTVEARPWRGSVLSRRLTPEERALPNAERLKRNLPPRSPVLGRNLPGRDYLPPTPVNKVKRGGASPSPSPVANVYTGRIQVRQNKAALGFVNNTDTGFFTLDVNGTAGTDLEVKIATTSGGGPFSLMATNALFPGPIFVGGGRNDTLAADSVAVVPLANVPQTKANAPPTPLGASAIWTVDPKTLQLKATWANLDGTSVPATIGYDAAANLLFFTGDINAFNGLNDNKGTSVDFFIVN